jgi:hypothetical protein
MRMSSDVTAPQVWIHPDHLVSYRRRMISLVRGTAGVPPRVHRRLHRTQAHAAGLEAPRGAQGGDGEEFESAGGGEVGEAVGPAGPPKKRA